MIDKSISIADCGTIDENDCSIDEDINPIDISIDLSVNNLTNNIQQSPESPSENIIMPPLDNQSLTVHSISNIIAEKEIDVCEMDSIPNITNLYPAQMIYTGSNMEQKLPTVNYHYDPYAGYAMQRMPDNRAQYMDCMKYSNSNMDGYNDSSQFNAIT